MPIRVAINGFGRIGRMAFRAIAREKEFADLEVVARTMVAPQVAKNGRRRIDEAREPRPAPPDQAPDDAKDHQTSHGVAQSDVRQTPSFTRPARMAVRARRRWM